MSGAGATVWHDACMWQLAMPCMVAAWDMGQACIHQQQMGRPATLLARLNTGASASTTRTAICRDRLTLQYERGRAAKVTKTSYTGGNKPAPRHGVPVRGALRI